MAEAARKYAIPSGGPSEGIDEIRVWSCGLAGRENVPLSAFHHKPPELLLLNAVRDDGGRERVAAARQVFGNDNLEEVWVPCGFSESFLDSSMRIPSPDMVTISTTLKVVSF